MISAGITDGEFVGLIGDYDFLLPSTLDELSQLISKHPGFDFFIDSFHLTTQHVFSFLQPFDIANLPENKRR